MSDEVLNLLLVKVRRGGCSSLYRIRQSEALVIGQFY